MKDGTDSDSPAETPTGDKKPKRSRRMALLQRAGLFTELPDGVTITRATTLDDLRDAYHLVHDIFVEEGYIRPFPGGLRMRSFEALPQTATFVAKAGGAVVAVQSLIPDAEYVGMPSDRAFREEIDTLRSDGRQICEAANEAVTPDYRKTSIPTALMRCCFAHAMSVGCTDVVTAVSPGHAKFYGLMGFETISSVRSFSEMLKDPVVVVRFNFDTVRDHVAAADDQDAKDEAILVDYYLNKNPFTEQIASWSEQAEQFFQDDESLRSLFDDLSKLLSRCNLNELRAIGQTWGEEVFVDVIGQIGSAFCKRPQPQASQVPD